MAIRADGMTFDEIKSRLRAIHGMSIIKKAGEYRVRLIPHREGTCYFTNDLSDAYHTAIKMRLEQARHEQAKSMERLYLG